MTRWLWVLLLTSAAWAVPVRFETDPPGATLELSVDQAHFRPLTLNPDGYYSLEPSMLPPAAPAVLRFSHPDCKSQEVRFTRTDLANLVPDGAIYRYRDTVTLPRDGLVSTLRLGARAHPGWAVVGLLGLLGLPLFAGHQRRELFRRQSRERQRDALVAGADRHDPFIDKVIGGYLTIQRLGSGGMATVYRAVPASQLDGEPVALKLIKPDLEEGDFRERFRREIQVSAALDHPHVVRVLDYGDHDGLLYLVMELVEGRPLEVVEHGLGPEETLRLLDPLVSALAYAHARGIVHRDLKPDNIMVGRQLKLMDFGIARSRQVKTVTLTGCAVGTPAYIAPEQVTGGVPDPRSDQYSLGVLLYEVLTGHRPFEENDALALLLRHMNDAPPRMGIGNAALESVVARMLAKEPERRFASVLEAWEAFRRAVADPSAVVQMAAVSSAQPRPERAPQVVEGTGDDTAGWSAVPTANVPKKGG